MACELELLGYASQSAFLLDNELLGLADTVRAGLESEMDRIALAQQIKVLTLPGEMGSELPVISLLRCRLVNLTGTAVPDLPGLFVAWPLLLTFVTHYYYPLFVTHFYHLMAFTGNAQDFRLKNSTSWNSPTSYGWPLFRG